jgi:hypothetical protein
MKRFVSAFNAWFTDHPQHSLRQISLAAGVDPSMLSMIRMGKRPVSFDAMTKLLPTIERQSSRSAAATLLIAYLRDETPDSHADTVRIEAIDPAGQPQADTYQQLAARWEAVARTDPEFMAMWQGLDKYMHDPSAEAVTGTTYPRPGPEPTIALLAEPMTEYKASPSPGHGGHDTIRHDAMPSRHAAQEHREE